MDSQSLNLSQQQRQLQTLSPQQVRYFKMLEMSQAQVEDEIKRAIDENPALEMAPSDKIPDDDTSSDSNRFDETAEEMQLADYANDDEIPSYRLEANNTSKDDTHYEPEAVEETMSLSETVISQARIKKLDDHLIAAIAYVAGNLDNNGYITRSVTEMANDMAIVTGSDFPESLVADALCEIRKLDPPGIGAHDLRDCLLLQLRRRKPQPTVNNAIEIIDSYFDLFSKKHYDRLASAMNIDRKDLQAAIELIKTLNPKPGGEIEGNDANDRLRHITPDFAVEVDGQADTITVSHLGNIPELQVEATFAANGSDRDSDIFIKRQREEAIGFISIINLRKLTLFRVINAIVKCQHDFFMTGDETMLRPMVLRDISEATGYDTSVVSRATQGKYILTPWGTFPLKFFFNERFNDSDDTSSRKISAAIKSIISNENPESPLTDEAVVKLLAEKGYSVARRTVAKYRENLGIPVARLRRDI